MQATAEAQTISEAKTSDAIVSLLPPELKKFVENTATLAEWREGLTKQIDELGQPALQEKKAKPTGQPRPMDLTSIRNAALRNILTVTANERALAELEDGSALYGFVTDKTQSPGTLLNQKNFRQIEQCLEHVARLQKKMAERAFSSQEHDLLESEIRERAIFNLSEVVHVPAFNIVTRMHEGRPKTVIFCIDPAYASAAVAQLLKAKLDIKGLDNVTALIIHSYAQSSGRDCQTYGFFYSWKYRILESNQRVAETINALFNDIAPKESYRLPWGKTDGAQVYYIEDDAMEGNRILPPGVIKVTQKRNILESMVDERGWRNTSVNDKGEYPLDRYDHRFRYGSKDKPLSNEMVKKSIKYCEYSLRLVDRVEIYYGAEEGQNLLQASIARARKIGVPYGKGVMENFSAQELQGHIRRCRENIEILQPLEKFNALAHELYLIDQAKNSSDSDDEKDDNDRQKIEGYAAMPAEELEKKDRELSKQYQKANALMQEKVRKYGRDSDFLNMATRAEVTSADEAQRLSLLEKRLAQLDDN